MKFTDRFFKFPIRIYDAVSVRREALKMMEGEVGNPDWIVGSTRLHVSVLEGITWYDGYSSNRSYEEINEEGFDLTVIIMEDGREYHCSWSMKKFEEKLNDFMKNYDEKFGGEEKDLDICQD